ncbi:myozenin-1b [Garra rufa]|uniref:myozenin-1b n=1 Tax=Garra rufa TaxID=137080 RepID=UPI003CCEC252
MPVSGTPAPNNKRKKPSKIITDFSNISQHDQQDEEAEAAELDLGTKIKTPKDVMLEELSLMKNKGSKMFKMRQQRVEKFIVSDVNLLNLQNLAPSLGCEKTTPPEPAPKPEPPQVEEVNAEEEKEKRRLEYVKTYVSPWERAMKGDEELKETMNLKMPGPQVHKDLPKYKSFNRTALGVRSGELNRYSTGAHGVGTGKPYRPKEEQRGWGPIRRTRVALAGAAYDVGMRALLVDRPLLELTERTHEASDGRSRLRTSDEWVLSVWQVKRFWDAWCGRLSRHTMGDQGKRHRMDKSRLQAPSK